MGLRIKRIFVEILPFETLFPIVRDDWVGRGDSQDIVESDAIVSLVFVRDVSGASENL